MGVELLMDGRRMSNGEGVTCLVPCAGPKEACSVVKVTALLSLWRVSSVSHCGNNGNGVMK